MTATHPDVPEPKLPVSAMGHIPTRSCRVCRVKRPKRQLARYVVTGEPDKALVADPAQRLPGRGYYACSDRCAEILPKTLKGKKR